MEQLTSIISKKVNIKSIRQSGVFYFMFLTIIIVLSGPLFPPYFYYLTLGVAIAYSIIDKTFIFVLLGSSNFLPAIGPISPMNIFVILLILKLLLGSIKLHLNNPLIIMLIMLVFWVLVSSVIQGFDTMFLRPLVTGFLTAFVVYEYLINKKIESKNIFLPFFIGVYASVIISIFSIFKLFGFYSTNQLRLTLMRGDSNSLGLSLNFIMVYLSANILLIFKKRNFNISLIYLVLLVPAIYSLILTGSRGSLLSIFIGVLLSIFYILPNKKIKKNINHNNFKFLRIFFLALIPLFIFIIDNGKVFQNSIDMFNFASKRLFSLEDTGRKTLYSGAILSILANPLFGIGIKRYTFFSNGMLPHNSYLDYALSGGLFGLSLIILVLALILIDSIKNIAKNGEESFIPLYIAFFAVAINQFTYSAVGDKLFWIPLSLIIANYIKQKSTTILTI